MIDLSRSIRSIAFASVAAFVLGAPLAAQEATLTPAPAPLAAQAEATAPANVGPTATAASVAVRRTDAATPAPETPATGGHGRGTALMIVGGAAVLTGIVIGNGAGYAISVVGAVVGLYGLYLYLQ